MSDTIECDLECRGLVLQPHRSTSATGLQLNATLCLAMYLAAWQMHIFPMHVTVPKTMAYNQNTKQKTIDSIPGNNYKYYLGEYNIKLYDYVCDYTQ